MKTFATVSPADLRCEYETNPLGLDNSFNHYSLGSVGEWLYRYLAGIDQMPDSIGFKKLKMQPRFGDGISSAVATYQTLQGEVRSAWTLENGALQWKVSIPPNATATAILPDGEYSESGEKLESARGVLQVSRDGGKVSMQLASGEYSFEGKTGGEN